jgi:hypothetical protein
MTAIPVSGMIGGPISGALMGLSGRLGLTGIEDDLRCSVVEFNSEPTAGLYTGQRILDMLDRANATGGPCSIPRQCAQCSG